MPAPLNTELRLPRYFERTSQVITKNDVDLDDVVGKNKDKLLKKISEYKRAGFTHLYVHNIGPHQEKFIDWFSKNILPDIK